MSFSNEFALSVLTNISRTILIMLPQLSMIEAQLATLHQHQVETLTLRSGIRWRKLG